MLKYRLDFLGELIRRKILERYIGSVFELLWIIVSPLIPLFSTLLVFFFIATIPPIKSMGLWGYAAFVLSGLLPYRLFQKSITEGCELILLNLELLKHASFPLIF